MAKIKGWTRTFHAQGFGYRKDSGAKDGFLYVSEKYQNKNFKPSVEYFPSYFGGVSEKYKWKKYFKNKEQATNYVIGFMRRNP